MLLRSVLCCPVQLGDTQAQYQHLQSQFEELKGDFQYNLQLLAERDAELEQADTAASSAAAELAAKANTVTQLQSQLAQAQSGTSHLAPCT
jgi:chromosome segregation ATPase